MGRFERIVEIEKRHDELEEIEKFNPYHDRAGRFSSSNGGGGAAIAGAGAGKYKEVSNDEVLAMAKSMGQDKMTNEDVNQMLDRRDGYFGTPNSFTINEDLREAAEKGWDEPVLDDGSYPTVEALDRNMRPSTQDIKLIRLSDDDFLERLGVRGFADDDDIVEKMQKTVGKILENGGYTSTSFDIKENVFKQRPVQLNINAPKGTKMLVSPARSYGDNDASTPTKISEAEILLARGTAMKITAVRRKFDRWGYEDGIEIDCEVLVE